MNFLGKDEISDLVEKLHFEPGDVLVLKGKACNLIDQFMASGSPLLTFPVPIICAWEGDLESVGIETLRGVVAAYDAAQAEPR